MAEFPVLPISDLKITLQQAAGDALVIAGQNKTDNQRMGEQENDKTYLQPGL